MFTTNRKRQTSKYKILFTKWLPVQSMERFSTKSGDQLSMFVVIIDVQR